MRTAVAEYYNRVYRAGTASTYGPANVCVGSGGRLVLTRVMAALGPCNVGYLLPDYTAYEDMLETHMHRLLPIPIRGSPEDGFAFTAARLLGEIDAHEMRALLLSNPGNPTGCVIQVRPAVDPAAARACGCDVAHACMHDAFRSWRGRVEMLCVEGGGRRICIRVVLVLCAWHAVAALRLRGSRAFFNAGGGATCTG